MNEKRPTAVRRVVLSLVKQRTFRIKAFTRSPKPEACLSSLRSLLSLALRPSASPRLRVSHSPMRSLRFVA